MSYSSKFEGWQLLNTETKKDEEGNVIKNNDGSDRIFVTKIIHAGVPELFAFQFTCEEGDGCRAEYLLSGGERQTGYSTLSTGETINPRNWNMYKDKNQENLIDNVHCLTREERWNATDFDIKGNEFCYWFANNADSKVTYRNEYKIYYNSALRQNSYNNYATQYQEPKYGVGSGFTGIRPVVQMVDGVYIKSGTGTEADPYILGKD